MYVKVNIYLISWRRTSTDGLTILLKRRRTRFGVITQPTRRLPLILFMHIGDVDASTLPISYTSWITAHQTSLLLLSYRVIANSAFRNNALAKYLSEQVVEQPRWITS